MKTIDYFFVSYFPTKYNHINEHESCNFKSIDTNLKPSKTDKVF